MRIPILTPNGHNSFYQIKCFPERFQTVFQATPNAKSDKSDEQSNLNLPHIVHF